MEHSCESTTDLTSGFCGPEQRGCAAQVCPIRQYLEPLPTVSTFWTPYTAFEPQTLQHVDTYLALVRTWDLTNAVDAELYPKLAPC